MKPKYGKKQNYVIWIRIILLSTKTDGIYEGIAEDVETRFDTSNYDLDSALLNLKNEKVIDLMIHELG